MLRLSSEVRHRLSPSLLSLVLCFFAGCGGVSTESEKRDQTEQREDRISSHIGEEVAASVMNLSTGNGPYSLSVEIVAVDEVRILFPNGGYRDVSLSDSNPLRGETWEGTDTRGDTWSIDP